MAYTPINWQTGDTITANKLNKMDNGWAMESTQLFSETVTTADQGGMYVAQLAYSGIINANSIAVTFDGTEYFCPRSDANNSSFYGGFGKQGPDFTNYPFTLRSTGDENYVFTQTASTHTIAVTTSTLQTSADFDKARGYGYVTGSPTELFNETVTTVDTGNGTYAGNLAYSQRVNADTITVTYDGTEYTCPSISEGEYGEYGAPYSKSGCDFSEFPFNLYTNSGEAAILTTQTAGEHTISATASVTSMQTSTDFDAAVKVVSPIDTSLMPFRCVDGVTTIDEVTDALENGRLVYFTANDETYAEIPKCFIVNAADATCTIIPTSTKIAAKFGTDDGLFFIEHRGSEERP